MRSVLRFVATAIVFVVFVATARADFHSGLNAYRTGNCETAHSTWQPMAESGHARAQFAMGHLLHDHYRAVFVNEALGLDREAAYHEAIKWLTSSAEQGYDRAQFWLARVYQLGAYFHETETRVEPDLEKAVFWYRRAANQGNVFAIRWLSSVLNNEEIRNYGGEPDPVEALMWELIWNGYFRSCPGTTLNDVLLSRHNRAKTPEQFEEAKRRRVLWQPEEP